MNTYGQTYREMVRNGESDEDAADFVDYCVAQDAKARKVAKPAQKPSYAWYRAIAANGRAVAVNVNGDTVRVWDIKANGPVMPMLTVAQAKDVLCTVRPLVEVAGVEGKWSMWFSR